MGITVARPQTQEPSTPIPLDIEEEAEAQREKKTSRDSKLLVVTSKTVFRRILRPYLGSEEMSAEINC